MSWYLPHRLTTWCSASSVALFCSISLPIVSLLPATAQAASVGKTLVSSAQHKPLAASIAMTDIKAAKFSASLANPVVYQQMGLTPNASMRVKFVATSATTGHVMINTTQPFSMPFADVVLTINDDGNRSLLPKTLLIPIADNSNATYQPNQLLAKVVQAHELPPMVNAYQAAPLMVNRVTPPLLFAVSFEAQPLMVRRSAPPVFIASTQTTLQARHTATSNTRALSKQPLDNDLDKLKQNRHSALITNQPDNLSIIVTRSINIRARKRDSIINKPQQSIDEQALLVAVPLAERSSSINSAQAPTKILPQLTFSTPALNRSNSIEISQSKAPAIATNRPNSHTISGAKVQRTKAEQSHLNLYFQSQ